MKKKLLLLFVLIFSLFVMPAQAQGGAVIDQMVVQLLPEYDRASMLVIYDFMLSGSGDAPQRVPLLIPLDAELTAVAREVDGSLVVEVYDAQVQNGWQVVTVNATPGVVYHIEYYDALDRQGKERHYTYAWQGMFTVNDFSISVLAPPNASKWTFSPDLTLGLARDGSTPLYGADFGTLEAGQDFTLDISYYKADDTLTAPPAGTPAPEVPKSFNERIKAYLPYILGGLGVLMLLIGAWLYWRMGRDSREVVPVKISKADSKKPARYCPQCGRRAEPGDRFCRSCGTRLRN